MTCRICGKEECFLSPALSTTTSVSKDETQTAPPSQDSPENILQAADRLIHGPRRHTAGHPRVNFDRIAKGWSVIFGTSVTPQQVSLAMIWCKVAREVQTHDRDNVVDIAGYAGTLGMLYDDE